jgi:hypothetical protein
VSETTSVKSFGEGRDWNSDDGKVKLTFYDCVFDRNGADFEANWGKQQGTGDPVVGESIEGEFFQKDGKWRFRKASKPREGTSSGGGGNYKPRPPEEIAGARHAHNLLVASENLERLPADADTEALTNRMALLKFMADALDRQTAAVSQAATEGGGRDAQPEASRSSPPSSSQNNGQATHERLAVLLEAAGVNDVAARTISDHVLTAFTAEEQDAAIELLENETRRAAAVKRLSERTVKATGEPLPRPTADDQIPF